MQMTRTLKKEVRSLKNECMKRGIDIAEVIARRREMYDEIFHVIYLQHFYTAHSNESEQDA